ALPNRLLRIDNFKTNAINVGIIGNIAVRYKGYDVLLKAISNLPDNIKNSVKIQFVGGGDPSYLKSLIERYQVTKHVTIRGKLKAGKEIFDFIDNLDIYIHPSKQEGLPRVVIE